MRLLLLALLAVIAMPVAAACSMVAPPPVPYDLTYVHASGGFVDTNLGSRPIRIDILNATWRDAGPYASNATGDSDVVEAVLLSGTPRPDRPASRVTSPTGTFRLEEVRVLTLGFCGQSAFYRTVGYRLLDAMNGTEIASWGNGSAHATKVVSDDRVALTVVAQRVTYWVDWTHHGAVTVVPFDNATKAPALGTSTWPLDVPVIIVDTGNLLQVVDLRTGVSQALSYPPVAKDATYDLWDRPHAVTDLGDGTALLQGDYWVGRLHLGTASWDAAFSVPVMQQARWVGNGVLATHAQGWSLLRAGQTTELHAFLPGETLRASGNAPDGGMWVLLYDGPTRNATRLVHVGPDGTMLGEVVLRERAEPPLPSTSAPSRGAPAPPLLLIGLLLIASVSRKR